MFNLDWSEVLVLLVLAVIIFGPEKLPELARKSGRIVRYLRTIANDATGRLQAELGPEFADLDLRNPREMVTKHLIEPVQAELEPLKAELEPVKAGLNPSGSLAEAPSEVLLEVDEAPSTVAFDPEAT
ncbi:sec-independent protein translocase protein TatB [Propionicimonas paludicola]|uniref:Sec-independent protein translocase protein TatB n=1 Tax=Propionicimonas paludicola TaxID=185243 RepID=A0A2A9CT41_9ACTN|nr:sec-independent translocase [Propionicimonas paludicola]PFG17296.1 sec-independent protein translocase protein TatB [Propionicimonas paludicola]